jgi:hypothetical protein
MEQEEETQMKIVLNRIEYGDTYTIGELFIDGNWRCFTLEDKYRQVDGKGVAFWKVPKQTAIPTGTYHVMITFSHRFQKHLPLILGVEGFEGIRIHTGNTDQDTEGCILVGSEWHGEGSISGSLKAYQPIFLDIQEAISRGDTVTIEVK